MRWHLARPALLLPDFCPQFLSCIPLCSPVRSPSAHSKCSMRKILLPAPFRAAAWLRFLRTPAILLLLLEWLRALNRALSGKLHGGLETCCIAQIARDGTVRAASAGRLAPYCNGKKPRLKPAFRSA